MPNIKPDQKALEVFLKAVDCLFPVPLSHKQDLECFAKKLYEKAGFKLEVELINGDCLSYFKRRRNIVSDCGIYGQCNRQHRIHFGGGVASQGPGKRLC